MGTKAAIFLPFLISCTRAHLRMAELGCLASMPLRGGGDGAWVSGEGRHVCFTTESARTQHQLPDRRICKPAA
jgi:hypothetical protein